MRLISTMYSGETSLNFIIGMRLWPPDSNFASGPSFCSRAIASSSVRGEKYSKLRGIIGRHLSSIGIDCVQAERIKLWEGVDHTSPRVHWSMWTNTTGKHKKYKRVIVAGGGERWP